MEYARDKKTVYVLDDGRKDPDRRADLKNMCEELGAVMLTRDTNDHAKAGNINTALHRTEGDLVLILDCDHIPVKGFLQDTVGFFFDASVALVQTPHWFYNPDPFERNLLTRGQVPVGNELFYKVLQRGNDAWNAAFFFAGRRRWCAVVPCWRWGASPPKRSLRIATLPCGCTHRGTAASITTKLW